MRTKPTPPLGIPLGAPYLRWLGSPAFPQLSGPRPAPPGQPHPESDPQHRGGASDPVAWVELLADRTRHRLTPMDVQQRRFRRVRQGRGYDMRQVDAFCDEVQAELVRLHEHIQQLQDRLHQQGVAAPPDLAAGTPPLGRVRVAAVHMAAGILGDALCQAEEIYRTAYQQAEELLADATRSTHGTATAGEDTPAATESASASPPAPADPPANDHAPAGVTPAPTTGSAGAGGAVVAGPWDAAEERP